MFNISRMTIFPKIPILGWMISPLKMPLSCIKSRAQCIENVGKSKIHGEEATLYCPLNCAANCRR